jgi:hypothetical protein
MSGMKGTAALIRLAQNPKCEVLGAMVLQPGSEKRFVERVTGAPYDREFGERNSARRRGSKFEQNAYAGDARLLREALATIVGVDAANVRVRNLLDDHPGTKDDARIQRLKITRKILADQAAGRPVPHIIIQPQTLLPTRPGPKPYFWVSPDLLVLSSEHGVYLPADLKSFIVRENEVAKADLARVRLQLGAQHLGLAHEYDRHSIAVPPRALLIFSKPNGLQPHSPRVEDIAGAVEAVRVGIGSFLKHRARIESLAAGAQPYTVVGDLQPHFQEACLATCVMSQWCRRGVEGRAADLGDAARDVLGDVDLARVAGLMTGDVAPASDQERAVAETLQRLAAEHGLREVA